MTPHAKSENIVGGKTVLTFAHEWLKVILSLVKMTFEET